MGGVRGFDPAGNPIVAPDAAKAEELFDQGKFSFKRGEKITVRSPDGELWDIPAEKYQEVRSAGGRLVSPEDARKEQIAREAKEQGPLAAAGRGAVGTVVNPLLTVGANLSPFASDREATRDVLRDVVTKEEAAADAYPVAHGVGYVGGMVAPALLTGGASLGARTAATGAAEAASQVTARGLAAAAAQRATVAGISNVAGATAENIAIKAAARLGASEGAKKVIGLAAQGAAEGMVQSASDAAVQATLNSPGKVAESMLMSLGPGALYGAAGNVLFVGGGGAALGAARKGMQATANQIKGFANRLVSVTRDAAEAAGTPVSPAAQDAAEKAMQEFMGAKPVEPGMGAKFAAKVTGAVEEDVVKAMDPAGAAAIDNPAEFTKQSARGMGERMRGIFEVTDRVDKVTSIRGAQYDQMRKLIPDTADHVAAMEFGAQAIDDMYRAVEEVAGDSQSGKIAGFNDFRKLLKEGYFSKQLQEAQRAENPSAAVAEVVDKLKTQAQFTFKDRRREANGAVRHLQGKMQNAAQDLREKVLASDGIFGERWVGWNAMRNEGYNEELSWKEKFAKSFLDIPESELASFNMTRDFDPQKLTGYIPVMGEFEGENKARALFQDLMGKRKRMEAVIKFADIDPDGAAAAREAIEKIDDMLEWHKATAQASNSVNAARDLSDQAKRRFSATFDIAGSVVGAALGGLPGAAAGGMAARTIARPDVIARGLASIRTAVGKRSGAILGAAGGVANRARGVSGVVKAAAKPAGRALVGASLFAAYRDKVREVTNGLVSGGEAQELDMITPGLSQAVTAKRTAALEFLKSKAPTGSIDGGMFGHLEAPKVTEYQARTFLEYVRGAEDPIGVLEEVRDGRVSPEAVEAVKAIYPETFAEIQQVVAEQLAGLKEPPPYQARLELYRVFGVASDRSLSPEFFASMTAINGQQPEAPQAPNVGAASGELSRLQLSDTARTLSR